MLADVESDLVERKETFDGEAPNAVRQAICAFANDLPNHRRAGVIFVGARDVLSVVLDASALLAYLRGEAGADLVRSVLGQAVISPL